MYVTDAIQQALESGQIGTPVAVRVFWQAATGKESVPAVTGGWWTRACRWLGESSQSLSLLSDRGQEQLTLLGRTAGGKSALISVGPKPKSGPLVEVVVFGSRGILSWESDRWFEEEQAEIMEVPLLLGGQPLESLPSKRRRRPRFASHGFRPLAATPITPWGVLLVAGDHTHQPGYAEALAADSRCRLIGLADEDDVPAARRMLNERLAHRLGVPVLPDLAAALRREDVQIVSICAEPERRGRIIVQAARAGKHLYLDKPLAGTLTDADAIVAAVQEHGVVAHMFSQVHWKTARRVRHLVESGRLGKLQAVHCDLCFAKGHGGTADLTRPRRESARPERFELADAKRELTNVGVYHVVLLLWLLHRPVLRVSATTGNYFFVEHQQRDVEDFGQMLLEFEGGLVASVTAGRTGWRSHPHGGLHRIRLVGTRDTAVIDAHRPRVDVWADVEPWAAPGRDPDDPMAMWAPLPHSPFIVGPKQDWILPDAASWSDDTKRFLDCVQHGRQSEISVELAATATEVLLAAYRSAAESRAIDLPLPRNGGIVPE